jgi:hypothetical protein
MNKRFACIPFVASLLLLACSPYKLAEPKTPAIAPFGPSSTSVGTICVIRPSHWSGEVTFLVRDDDQLMGATRGESWFCYLAEPGEHHIVSNTGRERDPTGTASITVVGGGRYYLHQDFDNVWGTIVDKLKWVEPQLAGELIEGCDNKVIVEVPGTERLPGVAPLARATPSSHSAVTAAQ